LSGSGGWSRRGVKEVGERGRGGGGGGGGGGEGGGEGRSGRGKALEKKKKIENRVLIIGDRPY